MASKAPGLIAFDLDGTLWWPEMYHLWGGGGSPFRPAKNGNVIDCAGTEVRLMGNSREVLHSLKAKPFYANTKIAYVSSTDEPEWARECMRMITISANQTLEQVSDFVCISKANKKVHFQRMSSQTGIPYKDMIFFDNEHGNIRNVQSLGVVCVHTPNGMTEKDKARGLHMWAEKNGVSLPGHDEL